MKWKDFWYYPHRLLAIVQGGFAKKGFWFQIHWFLGAVFGVIIAIVGVTGAALSFRSEITGLLNKEIVYVESNGRESLGVSEILEKANAALPMSRINSITLDASPDKTVRFSASDANSTNMRGRMRYINQYSGEVMDAEMKGEEFFALMVRWHRWLGDAASGWGKQTVAIATVALIILSLSGLYIYFPFMRNKFLTSLKVDFKQKGRIFLYRLHSAFGVWTLIFVLFMSFTGLWWSYGWYRTGLYWLAGVEPPAPRTMATGNPAGGAPNEANQTRTIGGENSARTPIAANQRETGGRENVIRTSGERESAARTASGRENVGRGGENASIEVANNAPSRANEGAQTNADYLAAAKAFDLFKKEIGSDYSTVTISLPQRASKVLNVSYYALKPAHSRASNQLQIDVEKDEIVKHTKYDDKTLGEKFISSIFPLHSGDFFGVVGLTLFCVSSLAMALFAITGYMLYFERFARNRRRAKKEKLN